MNDFNQQYELFQLHDEIVLFRPTNKQHQLYQFSINGYLDLIESYLQPIFDYIKCLKSGISLEAIPFNLHGIKYDILITQSLVESIPNKNGMRLGHLYCLDHGKRFEGYFDFKPKDLPHYRRSCFHLNFSAVCGHILFPQSFNYDMTSAELAVGDYFDLEGTYNIRGAFKIGRNRFMTLLRAYQIKDAISVDSL